MAGIVVHDRLIYTQREITSPTLRNPLASRPKEHVRVRLNIGQQWKIPKGQKEEVVSPVHVCRINMAKHVLDSHLTFTHIKEAKFIAVSTSRH